MACGIKKSYFEWLCECIDCHYNQNYSLLLHYLYNYDFIYILEKDDNRLSDGLYLRHRFGDELNIPLKDVDNSLFSKPCSIFEVMVALAIRCEESFMTDPDEGDKTGEWFWNMVDSLGLSEMSDDNFDVDYVDHALDRFINRQYKPNGEGGLFTVRKTKKDMRKVEIWYQMMQYLNEYLNLV